MDESDDSDADDRPLAFVDIDGVVADVRHRLRHVERRPKDWRAFFAAAEHDPPHAEGVAVVQRLQRDHDIVYLTGRPGHLRAPTLAWLERHGIGGHELIMRPEGDRRPAAVVKLMQLRRHAGGRTIGVVVDDDAAVLAAMREAGLPTFAAEWETRSAADDAALLAAQESDGRT